MGTLRVVFAQTATPGGTGVEAAGFGFLIALVALIVAAILARRR